MRTFRQRLTGHATRLLLVSFLAAPAAQATEPPATSQPLTQAQAETIFDYAYPLVVMKKSQDVMFTVPFRERSVPNHFIHFKRLAQPHNRAVVLGNRNTLYSVGWVDLSKGPVVFEVPDMGDRYYVMPLIDAWTNTFKSIGSRTTGQDAQKYFLVNQAWSGDVPEGYEKVVSPTNMVWITGRIQADSPQDAAAVGKLQDAYVLMTYAQAQGGDDPFADYVPAYEATKVGKPIPYSLRMPANAYFDGFLDVWADNASPADDADMVALLASIGMTPDADISFEDLDPQVQETLASGAAAKQAAYVKAFYEGTKQDGSWIFNVERMGTWGTDYGRRAYWAMWGLGANLVEDAVYAVSQLDADGEPLNGSSIYRLHFEADDLPPTSAFWSVTLYDEEGYLEANEHKRYSLGSQHKPVTNEDGSVDIVLSRAAPEDGANWVPTPKGNFKTLLRIYWPGDDVLGGDWTPPPLTRDTSS